MFSGSISASVPAPAVTPVVQSPSVGSIPKLVNLEQAEASIGKRDIPKFNPLIADALVKGRAPDVLDGPDTIGGMGTLQKCLATYTDSYVLGRIRTFLDKEVPIPQKTRPWYPALLTNEGKRELDSLIPGLAKVGSRFNSNERHALYAGLLRSLEVPEENLTMAPVDGSAQHRIYNALFRMPAVTNNFLNPLPKAVQNHLGDESLFASPRETKTPCPGS